MKLTKFVGAMAIATFGGWATTASADALRFAHVYEVGHPLHQAAVKAGELLAERTGG